MKRKILVTGGPVYEYLDAVKIITNKFKGGRMADLALELARNENVEVTYLCSKDSKLPVNTAACLCNIIHHDGFADYRKQVLELAPKMDAVVLGAAVANLIPKEPIKGKFPSHNYEIGETINIPFVIAPRVINEVKAVAPNTHIFGFKLLSNVPNEELIEAAYDVVIDSKATTVFANDANDLDTVYGVTKERAIHKMERSKMAEWIIECLNDKYYNTIQVPVANNSDDFADRLRMEDLIFNYKDKFSKMRNGMIFGTVAVRSGAGFLTTIRGKNELEKKVKVLWADHNNKKIVVESDKYKATLNAPLLSRIFGKIPKAKSIVHYHSELEGLPVFPYAPPGTVRDTERDIQGSFNIKEHGCFILLDENGNKL